MSADAEHNALKKEYEEGGYPWRNGHDEISPQYVGWLEEKVIKLRGNSDPSPGLENVVEMVVKNLEDHLTVLDGVIKARVEQAKDGKVFSEEHTENYKKILTEKAEYEKAIALLKSRKASFFCGKIRFVGDRLMRCVEQCEECKAKR
jgi:hypothetical protein